MSGLMWSPDDLLRSWGKTKKKTDSDEVFVFRVTSEKHAELAGAKQLRLGDDERGMLFDVDDWAELSTGEWAVRVVVAGRFGDWVAPEEQFVRLNGLLVVDAKVQKAEKADRVVFAEEE